VSVTDKAAGQLISLPVSHRTGEQSTKIIRYGAGSHHCSKYQKKEKEGDLCALSPHRYYLSCPILYIIPPRSPVSLNLTFPPLLQTNQPNHALLNINPRLNLQHLPHQHHQPILKASNKHKHKWRQCPERISHAGNLHHALANNRYGAGSVSALRRSLRRGSYHLRGDNKYMVRQV